MAYNVVPTPCFKYATRKLVRTDPSLKAELEVLAEELSKNPRMGTSLGFGFYKVRLAIKSKGKGKRGKMITFVVEQDETVFLLTRHDHGETDSISTEALSLYVRGLKD